MTTPDQINNRQARAAAPLPNQLAYRISDACLMVGIGKTKLYELAKDGRLRLIHVGGRTLVCGDSLRSLLVA